MKKTIALLLIVVPFVIKGQKTGKYWVIKDNIYMVICPSKTYQLYIQQFISGDVVGDPAILSFGHYYNDKEKGMLVLKDSLYGFKTILSPDKKTNNYIIKEGFKPLLNNKMEFFYLITDTNECFHKKDFTDTSFYQERQNFINTPSKELLFDVGSYLCREWGVKYRIVLNSDDSYHYYYIETPISCGQWKREGNLLVLTDEGLNFPFYMLIKQDGTLESKLLPGDYRGKIFTKE